MYFCAGWEQVLYNGMYFRAEWEQVLYNGMYFCAEWEQVLYNGMYFCAECEQDDNARGSRIAITVVYPISNVQLKIPRKLFKLPVNSSAAVNSLENYGPVNSLSVKNVKQ
jgi:hypothetical protein